MFEDLGYIHQYVNNKSNNCEDIIIYTHNESDTIIQFNLYSQCVAYQIKNTMKEYNKIIILMTNELLLAINKQIEELGWNK